MHALTWWTAWRGPSCCKSFEQPETPQTGIGTQLERHPYDPPGAEWPGDKYKFILQIISPSTLRLCPMKSCSFNLKIQEKIVLQNENIFVPIFYTFLFIIPKRAALASRAAYVSHRPVDTCWTKHMDSPYLISGMPIPSTSRFWATSTFSCSQEPRSKSKSGHSQNKSKKNERQTEKKIRTPQRLTILTFETRKQNADNLVLAFSGSTTNRPFSSSRHKYRPVVMWRIRKDCPHFMWLPLQLQSIFKCKHYTAQYINALSGQSPDSERLQPPQGPSLTAHSTTFIVSHPVAE